MLMKLRNLLVLGALLLAGSASAAIVERQKPAIEPIEVKTDGTYMYMYNVSAQKFFLGANDWDTRASVGDKGFKMWFNQEIVEGAEWDGKTVQWMDSVETRSGNKLNVFMENANGNLYVDNSGVSNRLFELETVGDKTYRLKVGTSINGLNTDYNAETYAPNIYIGCKNVNPEGASEDTRLYWNLSVDGEGVQLDWQFITVEGYEAHLAAMDVYNLAQNLKALVESAQAEGLDVAAQEAVYNNVDATTEELEAAIAAVQDVLAKQEEQKVDPLNPVDKTSSIVNPNMDTKDGWTTIDGVQNRALHTNVTTGAYTAETLPAYEHWNGSAYTGKFYQVIEGLPNGLYKLTAAVMGDQKPAAEGTGLYLYANDQKTPVVSNVPAYYSVFAEVVDNTIEIGWTAEIAYSAWISSDTYSLLYFGNKGEASYAGAVKGLVNDALPTFDGREAEMTVGLLDTYKATLNGLTAADLVGVNAAIASISQAVADVQTNIDGWVAYEAEIVRGNETRTSTSYNQNTTEMKKLAGYVARTAPTILKNKALSTEELLAEVASLTEMIEDAIFNGLQDNSDVTDVYLTNARYDDGITGWLGSWTAVNYGCMEAYETDWDAYQIVNKAPQGVYEVSLQGFYRVKRGDEAYNMYLNGQQTCPGHVYVNNHLNEVKCVFTEPVKHDEGYIYTNIGTGPESNPSAFVDAATGDSIFFPNDMQTAGEAFTAGMYVASANGLVAQEGDQLRIGVKGKKQTATWVIWDNFKMIFRGKQIAYTKPYLTEAIEVAKANLQNGMDKDTKALLETALTNGEAAMSSEDRDVVFNALVAIYAANDSVNSSAELFAELKAAVTKIENAIMQYSDGAGTAALTAASDLSEQIQKGVNNSSLTKAEAAELLAKVDPAIVALVIGEGPFSDDNPRELTELLSCPSFEDETGAASAAGWTGANGATGSYAYEFFQKTFDIYQEIVGVPNGTYRLTVSAFERQGSSVNDYDTYQVNPDTATTFLYAVSGENTYQQAVDRLASAAMLGNVLGLEGLTGADTLQNVEEGADSIMYVPNTMAAGANFFNDYEEYGCELYANVTDGTLRIGMKKEVQAANDWVMMDNFQLYYLGTESAHGVGELVLGTDAKVVKSEVFSVGGARVNKLQKGLNIIRRTHADGRVTMQKLYVK